METDEGVGPAVSDFSTSNRHLELLSTQLRSLRNATSEMNAAHVQLSALAATEGGIPSLRAYGERQETLARLAQQLAVQYDQFVGSTVNQLEGLALVVTNKYKAFCNKTVELRRRKAQLQLLIRQKERSTLRTLERSLIPEAAGAFSCSLEGPLARLSSTTRIWWDCYARLDSRRKVLLFTSSKDDPPASATRAVALSKYVLAHELQETFAGHAAAFELVPLQPELPAVVLAADGSMMARKWVFALQQALDSEDGEEADLEDAPELEGHATRPERSHTSPCACPALARSAFGRRPSMSPMPMPRAPTAERDRGCATRRRRYHRLPCPLLPARLARLPHPPRLAAAPQHCRVRRRPFPAPLCRATRPPAPATKAHSARCEARTHT